MVGAPPRMKVHSSATNCCVTRKSWLPVPDKPMTSQFSMISTLLGGSTAVRGLEPAWPGTAAPMPTPSMSAPLQPLANFQVPLTVQPPSTCTAAWIGNKPPAKTRSGDSAYSLACVDFGSAARYTDAEPKLATQPTEPSASEIFSINCKKAAGARPDPPKQAGVAAR